MVLFFSGLVGGGCSVVTTGLMGMPGLSIFSWAFSVGEVGFFCIRRACWFLWKIKLHYFNVYVMCVWYLLVGSKGVG